MTRDCQRGKQGKDWMAADLGFCGAPGRTRTCNLLFRRQRLYPLSYRGDGPIIPNAHPASRFDRPVLAMFRDAGIRD
jgi:hypothetical protein